MRLLYDCDAARVATAYTVQTQGSAGGSRSSLGRAAGSAHSNGNHPAGEHSGHLMRAPSVHRTRFCEAQEAATICDTSAQCASVRGN